ncbi:MAG: ABC transporter substrate-binding protein, partial [Candidatus Rokubacteria bacterium]|nr:ABC transporter substrate-binding protein [Candidatus Rokubacteria bacterium]
MEQARVGLIVALMCGLCLSARAGAAQDVKIGMMSPGGDVGKHAVEGARIAVEELNAAGGLHGRKVTLEVAEDGCDAAKAQAAFSALALRSGVVVVIGSFCRASVVATSSLGAQSGVLHLSGVRLETDILDKAGEGFYSRAYHTEEWTRILGQELLKQGAKSTELVAATDTFSKVAAKGLSTATGKAPRAFLLTAFQLDAKSAWAAGTTPDGLIFVGPAPVDASNIKFARAAGVK